MDSARFIRKPGVLAVWVLTPLSVIVLTGLSAYDFRARNQVELHRSRALEKTIPVMQFEAETFSQFLSNYLVAKNSSMPIENSHIAMLNAAAEKVEFNITSINIIQEPVDGFSPISRMNMHVEGSGSASSIAAFLHNIRARDRFIYEDRIILSPDGEKHDLFNLEADLCKIYLEQEETTK